MNCFIQIKNSIFLYLVSASLNFKDYIECTLKIFLKWLSKSQIRLHQSQKLAIDDIFIYSWRDLTPLLHIHLEITKKNLANLDAIKASVPKFLNFLGAELNNKWITHLKGKPFFWLKIMIKIKSSKNSLIYQKSDLK